MKISTFFTFKKEQFPRKLFADIRCVIFYNRIRQSERERGVHYLRNQIQWKEPIQYIKFDNGVLDPPSVILSLPVEKEIITNICYGEFFNEYLDIH